MSGYETPVLNSEGVFWDLVRPPTGSDLLSNCKLKKDAIVLPWTIDVDYKLNGLPYEAEQLAAPPAWWRSMSMLSPIQRPKIITKQHAAAGSSLHKYRGGLQPGCSRPSCSRWGTYKAVLFMALPGEADTFTIRIGTDCFETEGIIMMMIPGTLKQLERIQRYRGKPKTESTIRPMPYIPA